jgi:hypothetical protein
MSIVISTTLRDAKVNAAVALFDGGRIRFLTSADVVVAQASFTPGATFTPAVGGQTFLSGTLVDSFTGAGTIAKFEIETAGQTLLVSGSVSGVGGGGDIELAQTAFSTGDRFEVTNIVYTQPDTEPTP